MPYESRKPSIDLPTNIPIWTWLFDSSDFNLSKGFVDAATRERISYDDTKNLSTYASTSLARRYGLRAGDTICFFGPNTIWYPVAMFAALRVGGVISGASPSYTEDEMTFALKTVNARFIFTVPGSIEIAIAAAGRAGIPKERIFLLEGEIQGCKTLEQLIQEGRRDIVGQVEQFDLCGRPNGDVCAYLSFSSGTTGLPKAVMISHKNMIAQLIQVASEKAPDVDRLIAALPFFHIVGLAFSLHLPIVQNCDLVLMRTFDFAAFLSTIETFKIEEVTLAPPILTRLAHDPIVRTYDLSHVARWHTGAAPLSHSLIQELARRFPNAGVKHGYGLTENCGGVTVTPVGSYGYENAYTVGIPLRSTIVKIVDGDGKEVGVGEEGEILTKGPQVTMGYLNNAAVTRATFTEDGYLHTGDLGFMSACSVLTITGRSKDLIKVKGISISPGEIESLLLEHPCVEECVVVGTPDDVTGEVPRAFVVLKVRAAEIHGQDGERARLMDEVARELVQSVKEKKYKPKWLRGGVVFLGELPRNPSGKVLRRVLVGMGSQDSVVDAEVRFDEQGINRSSGGDGTRGSDKDEKAEKARL